MPDFTSTDLTGSRFTDVNLSDARFRSLLLNGTTFRSVFADRMEIDGPIQQLVVNGVDVMPLVEAELNRRDPDRVKMRPEDADGFREAWDILERRWTATVERARVLPPELLHAGVDEEWSFIQTLRHLTFATDAWVGRALLGDPAPWDPLDLPFDEMPPAPGMPWDRAVRPSLDEVLVLRADRQATVRRVLADLTDERLDEMTEPVQGPGWPPPESFPVRECLTVVLSEEWEHRRYAERDLDVLTARTA
jgi:DinB superfamily